jgi:hypothetical protein
LDARPEAQGTALNECERNTLLSMRMLLFIAAFVATVEEEINVEEAAEPEPPSGLLNPVQGIARIFFNLLAAASLLLRLLLPMTAAAAAAAAAHDC